MDCDGSCAGHAGIKASVSNTTAITVHNRLHATGIWIDC